jgi:hypothetical protein
MKHTTGLLLVVAGLLASTVPASAEFTLTIRDGQVTLIADNVTVRQILAEWARVGQTKIVNAEKLTGPPVTLRLENVPEQQALDILLRSSSGFMAAERAQYNPAASRYDRILVMPPSTAVASAGGASRPSGPAQAAPAAAAPPVSAPMAPATPANDDVDTVADEPPASPYNDGRPPETNFDYANPQEFLRRRQEMLQQQQQQGGTEKPALFPGSVMPYSQPAQPPAAAPAATPTAPGGAARPGEIVKPAQAQPAFVNPYGLPVTGAPPGQAMEPDRAKYANPYQPQPPKND